MSSNLMDNVSFPSTFDCKDFSRTKRRYAKLKQCKLDARREQWISQSGVKSKECCKEGTEGCDLKEIKRAERDHSLGDIEMKINNDKTNIGGENELFLHESDSEVSPPNSPDSSKLFGGTDSAESFTYSSSSTSSGGCCSGCITEEEEGDDRCLDDWETVADALAADNHDNQESRQNENNKESPCLVSNQCNARRADDAFRPHSLSFPAMKRHLGQGRASWTRSSAVFVPSSCPICYEDLDFTDSSFLPCSCGFKLCLFCHKRIVEEDGRCPGCRKPYEHDSMVGEISVRVGSLTLRLAPPCSVIGRS